MADAGSRGLPDSVRSWTTDASRRVSIAWASMALHLYVLPGLLVERLIYCAVGDDPLKVKHRWQPHARRSTRSITGTPIIRRDGDAGFIPPTTRTSERCTSFLRGSPRSSALGRR